MVTPRPLTITTPSGLRLHASEWSRHNAPVCLLLHGFAHDGRAWDPLALALHKRYRVIALDFRGHGDSSWDRSRSYCHRALLEDLTTLVEQLSLKKFHLVGHSMGARVAMLYSAANQEKISSLTIVDTGPIVGVKGANRIRSDAEQLPSRFSSREAYFQWLRVRLPLASKEGLQQRCQHGLRAADGGWQPKTDPEFARILWGQDNNTALAVNPLDRPDSDQTQPAPPPPLTQELWEALEQISLPALVVRGQLSSILQQETALEMVESRLKTGQLRTVAMAGHSVMLDRPEECSNTISDFIHAIDRTQGRKRKKRTYLNILPTSLLSSARASIVARR